MVSSGAFWVAISYRLAACFTGIGSMRGVEIYWRSFRHFGNYNYSLRKTVDKKMTKMGKKIDKNCAKIALFLYIFCICSLKISSSSKSRGARASVPHSWRRQWSPSGTKGKKTLVEVRLTCKSIVKLWTFGSSHSTSSACQKWSTWHAHSLPGSDRASRTSYLFKVRE